MKIKGMLESFAAGIHWRILGLPKRRATVEVLVGKNPTLLGSPPQGSRVSFEDFLHVKKKKKKNRVSITTIRI